MSHDPLAPVQYRLRHAAIVVTCAAIALAVAAPWLRTLPPAKWGELGMAVGVIAAATFAVEWGCIYSAGLRWPTPARFTARPGFTAPRISSFPASCCCWPTCQGMFALWPIGAEQGGLNISTGTICASAGCIATIAIANPCYVLITDKVLLVNLHFYPWRQLTYSGTDDVGDIYVKVSRAGVFYIRCADEAGRRLIAERAGVN
jgi:hypothetical protein